MSGQVFRGGLPVMAPLVTCAPVKPSAARA